MTDKLFVLRADNAMALRLFYLQKHYRRPVNFSWANLEKARVSLGRLMRACEPCDDPPPDEIVAAIADDLATARAVTIMHRYRKKGEKRKLFAALKFLGFIGEIRVPEIRPGGR
jgi:cysteinyl-tRNA synthetase